MIFGKSKFEAIIKQKQVKVAALPQDNHNWCLAMKEPNGTAYLGDNETQAKEFTSVSELIIYATELGAAEVIVITGAVPWKF